MENLTGQTLGQYELRELLGTGGMGAVYRGYQRTLRRDVAVKVLYTTLAAQTEYGERFVREAQTSAALEHPHIVPIYDYGTEGTLSFVVMRLLTGGSLAERIEYSSETGRPLPSLSEAVTITINLAGALDYAHSQGVIHRDIKDKNVMFDNQGRVFLVDFGIAKLMSMTGASGLTHTGATVGTPWYMAPEQWRGDPVTPAVDQYALAVTVYVMLTGNMPFEAETPYQLMHKHLHETPIPLDKWREDLPPGIGAVLLRALHKDPAGRYPSVSDFASDFALAVKSAPGASEATGFFTTPLPAKAALLVPIQPTPPPDERTQIELPAVQPPPMQASQSAVIPAARPGPPLWAVAAIVVALLAGIVVGAAVILPMVQRTPEPTGVAVAGGEATATHTPFPQTETAQEVEPPGPLAAEPTDESPTEAPTEPPSDTPAPTSTDIPPSDTARPTEEEIVAVEPLATSQPTETLTETPLPTETPVPPSATSIPPTETAVPTLPSTAAATQTPQSSATSIPPTATRRPTDTPTVTLTPTLTATVTPSETSIPPTATRRPTDTPAPTFTPTGTATPIALTNTPEPSATPIPPTATRLPSETPVPPVATATPTACQMADLNESGAVDIFDIRLLARAYGSATGDELYDARLDFDSSGTINILDLRRVTSQFSQTCEARG